MNKITCICLGVRDMKQSVQFYRDGLGFQTDETEESPRVIFFNTPGTKFELYPLSLLAEDISSENPPPLGMGFAGITLTYNVKTKDEVNEIIEIARTAGAAIVKEPQDVFWGGYHAYFSDPDGYYWEVAWGPMFNYDDQGMLVFWLRYRQPFMTAMGLYRSIGVMLLYLIMGEYKCKKDNICMVHDLS